MRQRWRVFIAALFVTAASSCVVMAQTAAPPAVGDANIPDELNPQEPDTDLFVLISGKCSTLKVAGGNFACRTVAYVHSAHGRAYFTIALDDPADSNHIISFSGMAAQRSNENLYQLTIDRMLLNSANRPKVDGLPVPVVERSTGSCTQVGNFATGIVSSIACKASDQKGRSYELQFASDGQPAVVRRVNPGPPTIRH